MYVADSNALRKRSDEGEMNAISQCKTSFIKEGLMKKFLANSKQILDEASSRNVSRSTKHRIFYHSAKCVKPDIQPQPQSEVC